VPLFHRGALPTGLVFGAVVVGYVGWTSFLALRADEIGHLDAGRLFLVYSVVVLCVRLFGATVPERVGLGRCAVFAVLVVSGALGVMALVDGSGALIVGSLGIGIGMALLYPPLFVLTVNAVHEPAARAAAVSTFSMFFEVGAAASGFLLGPVAAATSYRGAFGVGALVGLAGLVVLIRFVVLPRRRALVTASR
jgi:predicted MFS family arabinose efflux permease